MGSRGAMGLGLRLQGFVRGKGATAIGPIERVRGGFGFRTVHGRGGRALLGTERFKARKSAVTYRRSLIG